MSSQSNSRYRFKGTSSQLNYTDILSLIDAQILTIEERKQVDNAKAGETTSENVESQTGNTGNSGCKSAQLLDTIGLKDSKQLETEIIRGKQRQIMATSYSGNWDDRDWAALDVALDVAKYLPKGPSTHPGYVAHRLGLEYHKVTSQSNLVTLGVPQGFHEVLDSLCNAYKCKQPDKETWGTSYIQDLRVSMNTCLLEGPDTGCRRVVWALMKGSYKNAILRDPHQTQIMKCHKAAAERKRRAATRRQTASANRSGGASAATGLSA